MKKYKTFGECLAALLEAYKIKSSRLAKGINVDPSLVYKWLRNERVPSYNSQYIELIVNFLVRNISNSYQREAITNTLNSHGMEISETDDNSIIEKIRTLLLEAQGYSIEFYTKEKSLQKKRFPISNVEGLLKNMDTPDNTRSNNDYELDKQRVQILKDSDSELGRHLSCSSDTIKIIKGNKEVLYSALDLLKRSPEKPYPGDDTILITFNSNMGLLPEYEEFNRQWKHALYNILNNGWKVIFLVKLDNNIKRTMKVIEDMQLALTTGNFHIYYYKHNTDISTENELVIVPQTGALYCFSSHLRNQVDSAFLFHAKDSMDALSAHFFQFFSSAKPLLQSYPSQKSTEFQQAFAEAEENLGDRYVFKGGPSTITMPLHLYQKYLGLGCKTNQEFSYRIYLHKRRIDAFETQVKYYMYKDIWFKESIEKLVNKQKYSFDEYYIFENNTPSNADIVSHLENIINLLEKYENYEVAIVSKKDYENVSKICWMVKGNCSVLIEAFNNKTYGMLNSDWYNSEINLSITEKEVVRAFCDYFLILWNSIPDKNKSKKKNIEWLKSLIKELKKG